jgi:hypothetical protein
METINFERGQDPLTSMDIGLGWKKPAFELMQKLEKEGIKIESYKEFPEWNDEPDRHIFSIILSKDNLKSWPHDRIPDEIVYIHRIPGEIAEEGFYIFDKDNNLLTKGPGLSIDEVIKFLE